MMFVTKTRLTWFKKKQKKKHVNLIGSSVNMHVGQIFKEKDRFVLEDSKDFFFFLSQWSLKQLKPK